jgi:hypothetical protein
LALLEAALAKYLKRPSSSKKMEIMVIEKNKINILIGLIEALLVNCFPTSLIGANEKAIKVIAPINVIIQ